MPSLAVQGLGCCKALMKQGPAVRVLNSHVAGARQVALQDDPRVNCHSRHVAVCCAFCWRGPPTHSRSVLRVLSFSARSAGIVFLVHEPGVVPPGAATIALTSRQRGCLRVFLCLLLLGGASISYTASELNRIAAVVTVTVLPKSVRFVLGRDELGTVAHGHAGRFILLFALGFLARRFSLL